MNRNLGIVCAFGLVLTARAALLSAEESAPKFGVDSVSTYVVTAWDMQTSGSAVGSDGTALNTHRYLTSAIGAYVGAVHVPQGARILSIELEACDSSASGGVLARLNRDTVADSTPLVTAQTGDPDTPGCGFFATDLTTPEIVENNANRYLIIAENAPFDGTTTIGAVRVHYQLQVSPSPAIATFNDVPTSDPAFQFIEALAASGVTAGCGGGNYCPDAPLTRRQMAVFLSKALGLHWPDGPTF